VVRINWLSSEPREASWQPAAGSWLQPRGRRWTATRFLRTEGFAQPAAGQIAAQSPERAAHRRTASNIASCMLTSAPLTELAARGLASRTTIIHELSSRPAMSSAV
jgi:hypothetical protein